MNCLHPQLMMLQYPSVLWGWWGLITCCSVLKNSITHTWNHSVFVFVIYIQFTYVENTTRLWCFAVWAQLHSWLWMLKLHRFIFTPNHKSDEMDWSKYIYGDGANVVSEGHSSENKQKGSRWGNWKVSVIRTEVFWRGASRGLNWMRGLVLLTRSHSVWIKHNRLFIRFQQIWWFEGVTKTGVMFFN